MAVGFDSNVFSVQLDSEGRLPMPSADDTGLDTYTATVFIASKSIYSAIRRLQSSVTIMPALGGGGTVKIKAGPGVKVLTYPVGAGTLQSRYAVLTAFEGVVFNDRATYLRADLTFILGDDV